MNVNDLTTFLKFEKILDLIKNEQIALLFPKFPNNFEDIYFKLKIKDKKEMFNILTQLIKILNFSEIQWSINFWFNDKVKNQNYLIIENSIFNKNIFNECEILNDRLSTKNKIFIQKLNYFKNKIFIDTILKIISNHKNYDEINLKFSYLCHNEFSYF